MKKTILLFAMIMVTFSCLAQMKKYRNSAVKSLIKTDLAEAKESIDKAISYPQAETDVLVWIVRGEIYLEIDNSLFTESFKSDDDDADAIDNAYEAFTIARDMDYKGRFKGSIDEGMTKTRHGLWDEGVGYFHADDLDQAISCFEKMINISEYNHTIDTMANSGLAKCIEKKAALDKAYLDEAIDKYLYLVELKMKDVSVYTSLTSLYMADNNPVKALEIVNKGKAIFPDNYDLIIAEANIYISTNNHLKALSALNVAKKRDPKNVTVLYALGVTFDLFKNNETLPEADRTNYFNSAIAAYKEALSVVPDYYDALFNLGAIYYNKGGEIINEANKLPESETVEYDKMLAKGNNFLRLALPYLEKCETIQPLDKPVLISLKEIYTRLKMTEKLQSITDKLNGI